MPQNKFIFFDRDGTLNSDKHYVNKPEDLEILPGVIIGLQKLRDMDYQFICVTNQGGIAHKIFTEEQARICNAALLRKLAAHGIWFLGFYMCIHHPAVTGPCRCRKPGPGMVEWAIRDFKLDPSLCLFVGDKDSDIELGQQFGATTFLVENGQYETTCQPNYRIKSLNEIPTILEKLKPTTK